MGVRGTIVAVKKSNVFPQTWRRYVGISIPEPIYLTRKKRAEKLNVPSMGPGRVFYQQRALA